MEQNANFIQGKILSMIIDFRFPSDRRGDQSQSGT